MGWMMTMLYSVYRGPVGNLTSDGSVICASDDKWEDCMALRDGSQGATWVSHRGFADARFDSNRTQVLNLAVVKPKVTTSTAAESTASRATAITGAATGSDTTASTTTPATGMGSQVLSTTAGPRSSTITANPSFATRLSQGSQAGYAGCCGHCWWDDLN